MTEPEEWWEISFMHPNGAAARGLTNDREMAGRWATRLKRRWPDHAVILREPGPQPRYWAAMAPPPPPV